MSIKKVSMWIDLAWDNRPPHPVEVTIYPNGNIGFREKGRRRSTEVQYPLSRTFRAATLSDGLSKAVK